MMMLMGFKGNGGVMGGWKLALQYAFDVNKKCFVRSFDQFVEKDCSTERKERSDTNLSVYDDETARIRTFTALNTFKKYESRQFIGHQIIACVKMN